jgi:hypothetical protein
MFVPQHRASILALDHEDILAADRTIPCLLEDFFARLTRDFDLISVAACGVCQEAQTVAMIISL